PSRRSSPLLRVRLSVERSGLEHQMSPQLLQAAVESETRCARRDQPLICFLGGHPVWRLRPCLTVALCDNAVVVSISNHFEIRDLQAFKTSLRFRNFRLLGANSHYSGSLTNLCGTGTRLGIVQSSECLQQVVSELPGSSHSPTHDEEKSHESLAKN